ncbi:TonB-dependent siderophore receptor [Sphingosinicella sp. CPCC 101087]|uniref:TonB-dependent receptor plug domain-containing protein n=1 Tax=Sphingosinicella sp. CPCC 101087 TaxID=2497754 RepID=UPI00101C40B9|nr:TonB-dependent receptor [Sphingosinicella sp. CPCC 101087]
MIRRLAAALASGTCFTSLAVALPVPAFAQSGAFDISPGSLQQALDAWARQSGRQIIYRVEEIHGARSPGARGPLGAQAALEALLAGTGFVARMDSSGAVAIVRAAPVATSAGVAGGPDDAAAEIVVTGSHIRGVRDTASPTQTITRRDIEKTGYSTVEELFESLPQNFDEVTPEGRFANEGGSLLRGLNNSRVTAIDLRGLGAQSTLTLVNGTRRAGSIGGRVVDISAIPLSVIERVEIVTGGRSAIYGADAVAGVVNLVTRRSFDGAESQAYFGLAQEGGGERLQLSQLVGMEGDRGGFVAAYDFARSWPLDLADVGLLSLEPNPEIGLTQLTLNAQADSSRHSAYLAGRYDLTGSIEVHAETLYTHRRFEDFSLRFFEGAAENSFTDIVNPTEHLGFSGGARADLGSDWTLRLSGALSQVANTARTALFIDLGVVSISDDSVEKARSSLVTASSIADGPLFTVAGITPRLAIGAEWRREGFESVIDGVRDSDLSRNVKSAFAELLVPFAEGGPEGLHRLELSLAARYDDYSDVGGTSNPQIGMIWEPVRGLAFRGTYSTAFRAPALIELEGSVDAFLELVEDPAGGPSVPVLFIDGENPGLEPEEAETWTAGFDYEPVFLPGLRLSFSYFEVEYDGRIEQPSVNADRELVLVRADRFPGLVTPMPSAAQAADFLGRDADGFISNDTGIPFDPAAQNILDVFPDLVLFDNRTSNIAVETVRGLDFGVDAVFPTGWGEIDLGLNLTHTFEHERRVTPTSPAFSLLNEVGKPVDTRARLRAGWTRGAFGATFFVNHVEDYANPFSTPPSRMDSWTTVDLTLRLDGSRLSPTGFLKGLSAALAVQNLLDEDPPLFRNSLQGLLYDSANASPFGRYFSLRLTQRW